MSAQLSPHLLLDTPTAVIRDIVCKGDCRHRGPEECVETTHLVFPYRGVYVRHVGREDSVAEANQLLFFNAQESYRISHPIAGGDACLSFSICDEWLRELAPREQLREGARAIFRQHRLRIDTRAQALIALLRHRLGRKAVQPLEAETLTLALLRSALGERTSRSTPASACRKKLIERVKLVLSSDSARRWTLAQIAGEIGGSPVYLTQAFQQVEGVPLYRYQLRLRLARALDLLGRHTDLARLGMDLGFSSHSHFTAAFRQTYGCTPTQFQRSLNLRRAPSGAR